MSHLVVTSMDENPVIGEWSQFWLINECKLNTTSGLELVQWCQSVGLLRAKASCRRHRIDKVITLHSERGYVWYREKCKERESILNNSIFEDFHIPLSKAIILIYCFARSYTYQETAISCIFGPRESRMTNRTIEHWFDLFRDRLIDHVSDMVEAGGKIGGPGIIV